MVIIQAFTHKNAGKTREVQTLFIAVWPHPFAVYPSAIHRIHPNIHCRFCIVFCKETFVPEIVVPLTPESPVIMLNKVEELGRRERTENLIVPPTKIRDFTFSSLSDAL